MHAFYNEEMKKAGLPEVYYKMASVNPRNPVNMADEFEASLIRYFNENREVGEFSKVIKVDGKNYLYYAIPFLETNSNCMKCHGKREDAPIGLQAIYSGEGGFNEKTGVYRAIESIRMPIKDEFSNALIMTCSFSVGILAILLQFFFNKRLKTVVGDKTASLEAEIVERKQAEEALQVSEEAYRTVADFTYDWEYWLAPDGSIRYISPSCERHTGYSAKEFMQDPELMARITHPDYRNELASHLPVHNDVALKWYSHQMDFRIITRSGEERWFAHVCQPVYNDDGKYLGQRASNRDISERKRSEEEKLLLVQQLHQAQKMESLGVLAGGIAHDFNNILAVIMCYSSLAQQKPEKAAEFMPDIEQASERAAVLCRQMLAYAGKTQFVQSHVDMTSLLDEMLGMLKSSLPQNVTIKPYLSGDIPPIVGDASQLRQVAVSLIMNASEAIGEEQGNIRVALTKTNISAGQPEKDYADQAIPTGQYLCMEVTDTGCGMDDETKRRIFEPFYTTKFVGRGLGMSAVLGIITSHKGALQFTSQPGHGTTFKVYLPVQNGESSVESLQQTTPSDWRGRGTILLVEDEPQLITVARTLLESLGFLVIEASNGIEAIEKYRKNAADIIMVVTDIGMPLMDGYELIAELKKLDPALPVIVSSGFDDKAVTSKIPPEDIAGLISKPYRFDQLREVLRGVVGGTY
jgi:PAS domain S-box-containing protein